MADVQDHDFLAVHDEEDAVAVEEDLADLAIEA